MKVLDDPPSTRLYSAHPTYVPGLGELGVSLDPNIPLVRGLGELGVGDVEVLDDPLVSILEEELHRDAVLQPFYPFAVSGIKNIPLVSELIL